MDFSAPEPRVPLASLALSCRMRLTHIPALRAVIAFSAARPGSILSAHTARAMLGPFHRDRALLTRILQSSGLEERSWEVLLRAQNEAQVLTHIWERHAAIWLRQPQGYPRMPQDFLRILDEEIEAYDAQVAAKGVGHSPSVLSPKARFRRYVSEMKEVFGGRPGRHTRPEPAAGSVAVAAPTTTRTKTVTTTRAAATTRAVAPEA